MRAAAVVTLSVLMSTPALADWQPTKWGMTTGEVIAATGGRATANPDTSDDSEGALMMPYVEAGVAFTAYFQFDDRTKQLDAVNLQVTGKDCAKAFAMIKAKYGPPLSVAQGAAGDLEKWQDVAASNRISAVAVPSPSAAQYCSITYRLLAPAPRS